MEKNRFINPDELALRRGQIDARFHRWHEEEWSIPYPDFQYFRDNIADSSFLAIIEEFLLAASEDGVIDVEQMRQILMEKLGEYYREEKFNKVVTFFDDPQWDDL